MKKFLVLGALSLFCVNNVNAMNDALEISEPPMKEPGLTVAMTQPFLEREKIIASLDTVDAAYKQIFSEDSGILFANIDKESNKGAVNTIRNFIINVGRLVKQCSEQSRDYDRLEGDHFYYDPGLSEKKGLQQLVLAIDRLIHREVDYVGVHTGLMDKIDSWSTYGLIAKILTSSENRDEIRLLFPPCHCVTYSYNKFSIEDGELYRKELNVINELLKAGLISTLSVEVPFTNGDVLFETLKLNNSVNEVTVTGGSIDKLPQWLESANQLKKLSFTGEGAASSTTEAQLFGALGKLPLKEVNINLSADKVRLMEMTRGILGACLGIESLSVSAANRYHAPLTQDEIESLKQTAVLRSNLWELEVLGNRIPLREEASQQTTVKPHESSATLQPAQPAGGSYSRRERDEEWDDWVERFCNGDLDRY